MKSNTFEAFRPVFDRVVSAFMDAVHQHVGIDPRDLEDMPREDENAAVTRMFATGSPMLAHLATDNIEIMCEWGNLARGVYCDVVALTDGEQLWVQMNHSDVFDVEETLGADESFERLTVEVPLLLSSPVVIESDEDLIAQDYRTPKMVSRGSFWPHQEAMIRAKFPCIIIVDEGDQERAQQVIRERQLQEQDEFLSDVGLADYVTLVDGMYAFKSKEEAALFATFVPTREICTIEDVWND